MVFFKLAARARQSVATARPPVVEDARRAHSLAAIRRLPISINLKFRNGFSTPKGQEDSARVLTREKCLPELALKGR